jgi:hypothetical protein
MYHMQQFFKQKELRLNKLRHSGITIPLSAQEYNRGHDHLNLFKHSSSIISDQVHPQSYDMIYQNCSHLTANSSL